MLRLLTILALAYVGLALIAFLAQRGMLYHPSKDSLENLSRLAAGFGFQPWRNTSGEVIGWKQLSATNRLREQVLIVHGNAGSAINRVDYADGVKRVMPCDVYLLEYPGYGARPGAPTQTSLFAAADEAMALIEKNGPVYLIGESLGTGVAAYLAGTHPRSVAALLLMAPFHNLSEVAQNHMPIFPVRWMLWDRFPSAQYLRNYHGPVAVVLAGQDEVIPKRFGQHLYQDYHGPKKLWEIPGAYHNDLPEQPSEWWQELVEFWNAERSASGPTIREEAKKP